MFTIYAALAHRMHSIRRFVWGHRHRRGLAPLTPADREVVAALEQDGAYRTSLVAMAAGSIPGADRLCGWAAPIAAGLVTEAPPRRAKSYVIHGSDAAILAHPEVLLWGLGERLLSIVEHYIGLPIAYRGITVRRDLADGQYTETRLRHKDNEDTRIVKIIVYLNGVTEVDGPFCYIPKTVFVPRRLPGRLSDPDMDRLVPRQQQVQCTGPAGTVVFADTCNVWHRGKVPESNDRLTIFYSYNSQMPRQPKHCQPLLPPESLAGARLTEKQRAAVRFAY